MVATALVMLPVGVVETVLNQVIVIIMEGITGLRVPRTFVSVRMVGVAIIVKYVQVYSVIVTNVMETVIGTVRITVAIVKGGGVALIVHK